MRHLIVPPSCITGLKVQLEGALHHHVCHVLRLRVGAQLLISDGSGARYRGQLIEIHEELALVQIEEEVQRAPAKGARLTLLYGLSRRAHTEHVLQKVTELGVDSILLAACQRSVARHQVTPAKIERWQEIICQAGRQSQRSQLPELFPPVELEVALHAMRGAPVRLLAHPGGLPLSRYGAALAAGPAQVALAVGPEGGFAPEEVSMAQQLGFELVGLGPLILRTETAATTLTALAAFLCGRLEAPPPAPTSCLSE